MDMVQPVIPYPSPHVFDEPTIKSVTDIGPIALYEFDHAEYPENSCVLVYKKGLLFPTKGFVFPQAIQCINVAKSFLIDTVYLALNKRYYRFYVILLFSSFKYKVALVDDFLRLFTHAMNLVIKPIAPKRNYQIDIAQELWGIVETFLKELGVKKEFAEDFALIFATCINYDNAYHFRLIDLFSETTKEKMLENPVREIKKIVQISAKREHGNVKILRKFKYIGIIIRVALLSKRVRNAFKKAIEQSEFTKMQYDKIDRYNTLDRGDYDFMGLTYEQRQEIFYTLHKGNLPKPFSL